MSVDARSQRTVCQPLRSVTCACPQPLPYSEDEAWGDERYCAKCGHALPGTAERRRLQQVVFVATHPPEREPAADGEDDSASEDTAPAPAEAQPDPGEGSRRSPLPIPEPWLSAGALAPLGRVAHLPLAAARPTPTPRPKETAVRITAPHRHHHLALAGLCLTALWLWLASGQEGPLAEVIRNAAGIPDGSPEGLGKFVAAADRLLTPATLAAASVMPFGVIAGGLMMGFGRPKGVMLVAASLGALVLIASAKGLVL